MVGISGTGIGLRGSFIREVSPSGFRPDWFEITPENWMRMPHIYRDDFEKVSREFPLVAHGVSLSLGSPDELSYDFLARLKRFLDKYKIMHYSEHLSFSAYQGRNSYELLPVPMTKAMAGFISDKIKKVSDFLERPLILENASWYFMPYAEMDEADFINLVLENSGAPFLLDVNNVYVNSVNHRFDPYAFMNRLDIEKTAYIHVAGHTWFPEDKMIIDTHGDTVREEVYDLLGHVLEKITVPVMIERDNNIPPLPDLVSEYNGLKDFSAKFIAAEQSQDENRVQEAAAPTA